MSILEVRRHSIRKTGAGSQLSQEGVDLARLMGSEIGPFTRVVTSVSPRARETAVAMGFAVDHEVVTLSMNRSVYEDAVRIRWWEESLPFSWLARSLELDNAYSRYAKSLASLWRDLLTPLSENDSVLLIGHSGEIEAPLVACFPDEDHGSWGSTFGPCEGARLWYEGEMPHFSKLELLRVPQQLRGEEEVESDEERLPGL